MRKFKNIKPGDTVMIPTGISEPFDHHTQRVFYTPRTVARVTETLFEVDDDGYGLKFCKESGKDADNNYAVNCARLPSEIYDQSKELEEYNDLSNSIYDMSVAVDEAQSYMRHLSGDVPKELVDRITSTLKELEAYRTRK